MARADLLCDLIRKGLTGDYLSFRKVAEAISAEERSKRHIILAKKIDEIILTYNTRTKFLKENTLTTYNQSENLRNLLLEKVPERRMGDLILPDPVTESCEELIQEQLRTELLYSHGLRPRNRVLLVGPPGNGKTSLAEAIAEAMMIPFYVVRYEGIVGAYLGETATKLSKLFDYIKTRQCVLFFDEFETLGKERADEHETGEIKRVVSSLLLQIDSLPSYVVVIAATNHDKLLDKAVWRRFQLKLELPKPSVNNISFWIRSFEKRTGFQFEIPINMLSKELDGFSYSEIEDFSLNIYRQHVLQGASKNCKNYLFDQIRLMKHQKGS